MEDHFGETPGLIFDPTTDDSLWMSTPVPGVATTAPALGIYELDFRFLDTADRLNSQVPDLGIESQTLNFGSGP